MSLDSILGAIPERGERTAEVDISEWIGQEAGTSVLRFREPGADTLFTIHKDAEIIKVRNARWPEELCQSIALIALSHVEPRGDVSPGEFYVRMCQHNWSVFLRVLNAFQAAFPALRDWETATAEGKAG